MNWTFNFGWFLLGLLIFISGACIVLFYRQIADNFVNGVSSYDKTKLFGIITAIVGLLVMTNLHTALLTAFVNLIFLR